MQQTILALGALLIIMTTAMLHQQSTIKTKELGYIRQLETAALDLGRKNLEGLSTLAFDESTVGSTSIPLNTTGLTSAASFGYEALEVVPDDVDDYHGLVDTLFHAVGTDSFAFRISYSVEYVTTAGAPSGVPTFNKQLTANVVAMAKVGSRQVNGTFTKIALVTDNL